MLRSTYKELLIYRAWATCALINYVYKLFVLVTSFKDDVLSKTNKAHPNNNIYSYSFLNYKHEFRINQWRPESIKINNGRNRREEPCNICSLRRARRSLSQKGYLELIAGFVFSDVRTSPEVQLFILTGWNLKVTNTEWTLNLSFKMKSLIGRWK